MVGRDEGNSPFLAIPRDRWFASNHLAFAVLDRFPVSPGHILVVPRRVVAQWWDADRDEQTAILDLVDDVRDLLLDDVVRAAAPPPPRWRANRPARSCATLAPSVTARAHEVRGRAWP